MKELHKRSRNPKFKKKYKVTNWKEYEQSLCNRGSLTLWISNLGNHVHPREEVDNSVSQKLSYPYDSSFIFLYDKQKAS